MSKKLDNCQFDHLIQLQLADANGFLVPETQFWITLTIVKNGSEVTIQFPTVNFQTGPSANNPYEDGIPPLIPGGYIYTSAGFLPKPVRPTDLVYRSYLAASNNGMSQPFSFTQDPSTLPTPPAGYILQVTNAGAINIQAAGTFGNVIPVGPQIMLPTDISYIVKPKIKLGKNTIIQSAFINTTQFTGGHANNSLRDVHINDAFDNVCAWAWTDNSNVPDKTNGIVNVFVAVGKVKKDGTLKVREPIQLTNIPVPMQTNNTSTAINRTNKNNIVVGYAFINFELHFIEIHRAVSFDGGKTWPVNGLIMNVPSNMGALDVSGVAADKFGNFWYSYGAAPFNQPTFIVSSDGGLSFQFVYQAPGLINPNDLFYDFPQYRFGGDGQGGYGLWSIVDYVTANVDIIPTMIFIPITGLGQFGTGTTVLLNNLINTNQLADIVVSADGRVWIQGIPDSVEIASATSFIQPTTIIFKSPGPIDQNYSGPWNYGFVNALGTEYGTSIQESQPSRGYLIVNGIHSSVYDDDRQALYAMFVAQFPDYSQDMRLYFVISRNNGQTWSQPIDIESSFKNNRGFQSMALDVKTGNLIFGWYDARNSYDGLSVQYFGTVITSNELDCLVKQIPLSNPIYIVPSATGSLGVKVRLVKSVKIPKKHQRFGLIP